MKTIFTILLATMATVSFAKDEGRLTISFAARNNVQVVVDNRAYTVNDNSIVLNNISPGHHTVRIYKARRNGGGRNGSAASRRDLLYSSTIYVRPAYHVDVMINRFGKALVDEQALDIRNEGWDQFDPVGNGGYGNGYNQAMSDADFNALMQRIKGQWYSSGKMTASKDALTRTYVTTVQLRQVLQLFSFESERLELAKLAFRNTVDNRNFYQLYDLFQMNGSREELDALAREYR